MLNTYTLQKELLSYGLTWEETEYYIRNPEELKKLLENLENNN